MALLDRLRRALGARTRTRDPGEGTGRLGPWAHDRHGPGTKDLHALDVHGDPRGGEQSSEYRLADPRDLIVMGDVAMMGPAGSPVDEPEAVPVDDQHGEPPQSEDPVESGALEEVPRPNPSSPHMRREDPVESGALEPEPLPRDRRPVARRGSKGSRRE